MRANQRVHGHNERNFSQTKLSREIKARFLLNEHGNLYFYCIVIVYILSFLILKNEEMSEGKKEIQVKECTKPLPGMQIMTAKTPTP